MVPWKSIGKRIAPFILSAATVFNTARADFLDELQDIPLVQETEQKALEPIKEKINTKIRNKFLKSRDTLEVLIQRNPGHPTSTWAQQKEIPALPLHGGVSATLQRMGVKGAEMRPVYFIGRTDYEKISFAYGVGDSTTGLTQEQERQIAEGRIPTENIVPSIDGTSSLIYLAIPRGFSIQKNSQKGINITGDRIRTTRLYPLEKRVADKRILGTARKISDWIRENKEADQTGISQIYDMSLKFTEWLMEQKRKGIEDTIILSENSGQLIPIEQHQPVGSDKKGILCGRSIELKVSQDNPTPQRTITPFCLYVFNASGGNLAGSGGAQIPRATIEQAYIGTLTFEPDANEIFQGTWKNIPSQDSVLHDFIIRIGEGTGEKLLFSKIIPEIRGQRFERAVFDSAIDKESIAIEEMSNQFVAMRAGKISDPIFYSQWVYPWDFDSDSRKRQIEYCDKPATVELDNQGRLWFSKGQERIQFQKVPRGQDPITAFVNTNLYPLAGVWKLEMDQRALAEDDRNDKEEFEKQRFIFTEDKMIMAHPEKTVVLPYRIDTSQLPYELRQDFGFEDSRMGPGTEARSPIEFLDRNTLRMSEPLRYDNPGVFLEHTALLRRVEYDPKKFEGFWLNRPTIKNPQDIVLSFFNGELKLEDHSVLNTNLRLNQRDYKYSTKYERGETEDSPIKTNLEEKPLRIELTGANKLRIVYEDTKNDICFNRSNIPFRMIKTPPIIGKPWKVEIPPQLSLEQKAEFELFMPKEITFERNRILYSFDPRIPSEDPDFPRITEPITWIGGNPPKLPTIKFTYYHSMGSQKDEYVYQELERIGNKRRIRFDNTAGQFFTDRAIILYREE